MAGIVGQDIRSTTGKNLKLIMELTGLDPLAYGALRLREALINAELVEVPPVDRWRVRYLSSLLEERQRLHYSGNKHEEEILSTLIDSLCVN